MQCNSIRIPRPCSTCLSERTQPRVQPFSISIYFQVIIIIKILKIIFLEKFISYLPQPWIGLPCQSFHFSRPFRRFQSGTSAMIQAQFKTDVQIA